MNRRVIYDAIALIACIYCLVLGVYPTLFVPLVLMSSSLLVLYTITIFKRRLWLVLRPGILGSSLGLLLLCLYVINAVIGSQSVVNKMPLLAILSANAVLLLLTLLTSLRSE